MPASKLSISQFLGTLDYLMGLCSLAEESKEDLDELTSAFPYIRGEIARARLPLEGINLFQLTETIIGQVEKLVISTKIYDANRLVLSLALIIGELSGQNDSIRRNFGPPKKKANQDV